MAFAQIAFVWRLESVVCLLFAGIRTDPAEAGIVDEWGEKEFGSWCLVENYFQKIIKKISHAIKVLMCSVRRFCYILNASKVASLGVTAFTVFSIWQKANR